MDAMVLLGLFNVVIIICSTVIAFFAARFNYIISIENKKNNNPRLFVKGKKSKMAEDYHPFEVFEMRALSKEFSKPGFTKGEYFDDDCLITLELHNNGPVPAYDIELNINFIIQAHHFEFGFDRTDIENYYLLDYKKMNEKLKFDYIAPNDFIIIDIAILDGKPPAAYLEVVSLKSNNTLIFIDKKIKVLEYRHPMTRSLHDSSDFRNFIGII